MTTANDKLPRVITRTTVHLPPEGGATRYPEPLRFTNASLTVAEGGALVIQSEGLATILAAGYWASAFTVRQDG